MSKKISSLRTEIRQILRDEYVTGASLEFNDGELDQAIFKALVDVSQVSPYLTKETLTTTADSKELDISTLRDDLLFISHVEYKISQNPQQFRNVSLVQDTLTMDINWDPAASESVYLYCGKVHTLNEGESTLWPQHERAILDGAAGYAAQNWLNKARTDITEATTAIDLVNSSVDEVADIIARAVLDVDSGRTKVVAKATEISAAIDKVTARVEQAVTDLVSGRTYMAAGVNSSRDEAITAIGNMTAVIARAITDIDDGRTGVGVQKTAIETSIAAVTARVEQAASDLTAGRSYMAAGEHSSRDEAITAIGSMTAELALAVSDLADSRTGVGLQKTKIEIALDAIAARITASVGDLTSGRTYMAKGVDSELTTAISDITAARAEMVLAVADIKSQRDLVGDYDTASATSMGLMDAQIVLAVADIAAARTKVDTITPARTVSNYAQTANGELNNASARLVEARAFLSKGEEGNKYRALAATEIQSANAYMSEAIRLLQTSPAQLYGTYAARELQNANAYIAEARGFLAEETFSQEDAALASRELQAAAGYLNQAKGYLSTDREVSHYSNYAARELQNANTYMSQARAYLAEETFSQEDAALASRELSVAQGFLNQARTYLSTDREVSHYGNYASKELQNATAYLNQARGYLAHDAVGRDYMSLATRELSIAQASLSKSRGYASEASLRLQNVRAMAPYINWANNKLAEFRMALSKMSAPRVFKEYPRN